MAQNNIKRVNYTTSNSYETWGKLSESTKHIWIVFHGIGYLSTYFLKPFQTLDPEENYIIAPQAPSKYYLNGGYKYVGASWLTKVDTEVEMQNNLAYLDAVLNNEKLPTDKQLLLFGFSQGVSVVMRWMARRKISCEKLFIYAGGIPNELEKKDFDYLNLNQTSITLVYGEKDEFLTSERIQKESKKAKELFGDQFTVQTFEGGHEVRSQIINRLV